MNSASGWLRYLDGLRMTRKPVGDGEKGEAMIDLASSRSYNAYSAGQDSLISLVSVSTMGEALFMDLSHRGITSASSSPLSLSRVVSFAPPDRNQHTGLHRQVS